MYRDVLHDVVMRLSKTNHNLLVLGLQKFKNKSFKNKKNLNYIVFPNIKNEESTRFNLELRQFLKNKRNYFLKK